MAKAAVSIERGITVTTRFLKGSGDELLTDWRSRYLLRVETLSCYGDAKLIYQY